MSDSQPTWRGDEPDIGVYQEHRNRDHVRRLLGDLRAHRPADLALFTYKPVEPPPDGVPAALPPSPSSTEPAERPAERGEDEPWCLLCASPGTAGADPTGAHYCARHWREREQRIDEWERHLKGPS